MVEHDRLVDAAVEQVGRIAERSPDAYAVAKRVLSIVAWSTLGPGLQAEALGQSLLIGTPEHRERLEPLRTRGG